jgi:hypothetical protein
MEWALDLLWCLVRFVGCVLLSADVVSWMCR